MDIPDQIKWLASISTKISDDIKMYLHMRYKLLISGFMFSIGLMAISGFYALDANRQVLLSIQDGEAYFRVVTTAAAEASSYAKRAEGHLVLYLALHRKEDREKFPKRMESLYQRIAILDEKLKDGEAKAILEGIKNNCAGLTDTGNELISLHDNDMEVSGKFEMEKYRETIFDLHDKFSVIRELGVSLVTLEVQLENNIRAKVLESAKVLKSYLMYLIVATLVFSMFLGCLLIYAIRSLNREIARRMQSENELLYREHRLKEALEKVETLRGLLPICANCKKIRDDKGYWKQLESYISQYSDVKFSHSICPECFDRYYLDTPEKTDE